ncbi:MAG TPA: universal stress protein [Streptosporangiaceae bacterium]|nr:universal stress protein [Streptosporangiaceae bacterium]
MPGITVGVDGSANAKGALEWAMREAATRKDHLTVLTVNEIAASFWSGRPVTVPADEHLLETAREAATELADKAAGELGESQPASVTIRAVNGFAADELVNASKDADLLVVGARGGAHSGGLAGHAPIGSISNKVLHHAQCPVVVVPAR